MRCLRLTITFLFLGFFFGTNVYSQTCDNWGRIDEIYHTSCFPWYSDNTTNDGYVPGYYQLKDDTKRLQRAIDAANYSGKLFFDETDYHITGSLNLASFITIEGTGRGDYYAPFPPPSGSPTPTPTPTPSYRQSKIIQMGTTGTSTAPLSIFTIGEAISDVKIHSIILISDPNVSNTVGILAQGTDITKGSLNFEFSDITFKQFTKGIYVNANDIGSNGSHQWQFDNVRLENAAFNYCDTGIYINSYNSGWTMSNVAFLVPKEESTGGVVTKKTYGIYLERSTYTSMNMLIGAWATINQPATAFIYVKEHKNLSISNSIDEGFKGSFDIEGGDSVDRASPIYLTNNYIQSQLTVNNSTVVSTSNQFYGPSLASRAHAVAKGYAEIYSIGDKFCYEGVNCQDISYDLQDNAKIMFGANQYKNIINLPILLGLPAYGYNITRAATGNLDFYGIQTGYTGYNFRTAVGTVKINYSGSVTYGSTTFSNLSSNYNYLEPLTDGTVIYCSDCQKTTPCSSGSTTGAIAKRLGGSWDCN